MTKQKSMKSSSSNSESIDLKDLSALSFPDLPNLDPSKSAPRFSAILKRQKEDVTIGLEDLDALQLELEALLTSVTLRKLSLKEEVNILRHVEKYKGQKLLKRRGNLLLPEKRSSTEQESSKPSKKLKPTSTLLPSGSKPSRSNTASSPLNKKPIDPLENEQIRPPAEQLKGEDEESNEAEKGPKNSSSKPTRNETPSRFWAFVEPYCAPIRREDIKLLEDLLQSHEDLSEYYRIPPLGEHYAKRWALEDMESERLKGSGVEPLEEAGNKRRNRQKNSLLNGGVLSKDAAAEPPVYDLTQRLIAGLMEENVLMSVEDNMDGNRGEAEKDFSASSNNLIPMGLEARVRKELEDQGILEKTCNNNNNSESSNAEGSSDEVLSELKHCQLELKALSAHNMKQLRRLLVSAQAEVRKQDLRKKLQEVDEDVMEAYKKISLARSKKRPPSKKERDFAWKALKERDLLLERLESIV